MYIIRNMAYLLKRIDTESYKKIDSQRANVKASFSRGQMSNCATAIFFSPLAASHTYVRILRTQYAIRSAWRVYVYIHAHSCKHAAAKADSEIHCQYRRSTIYVTWTIRFPVLGSEFRNTALFAFTDAHLLSRDSQLTLLIYTYTYVHWIHRCANTDYTLRNNTRVTRDHSCSRRIKKLYTIISFITSTSSRTFHRRRMSFVVASLSLDHRQL